MELDIWGGDWSIPSVEPNCLTVMAYCKFSGVPIKVTSTNKPWNSSDGSLPHLRHGDIHHTRVSSIFSYLRKQNYGCEFELSVSQSSDMLAFLALIEEKLMPALCHLWWVDGKTYAEVTRPWFGKAVTFPFSLYYPNKMQGGISKRLYATHPNLSAEDVEMKIYRDARECLNLLSAKLGGSDFFFGKNPTALDAVVYGYLAPLLMAPLQNNSLSGHLKIMDNLTAFIRRVQTRYFGQEIQGVKAQQEEVNKKNQADLDEYPNKYRNIVLAGLVATSAMVGYALLSGMIQIEITPDSEEEVLVIDDCK